MRLADPVPDPRPLYAAADVLVHPTWSRPVLARLPRGARDGAPRDHDAAERRVGGDGHARRDRRRVADRRPGRRRRAPRPRRPAPARRDRRRRALRRAERTARRRASTRSSTSAAPRCARDERRRTLLVLSSTRTGRSCATASLPFAGALEEAGVSVEVVPWPKGPLARRRALRRAHAAGNALVSSRLLTCATSARLRRAVRRLLFDFDDALPFRDTARGATLSGTRRRRSAALVRAADAVLRRQPVPRRPRARGGPRRDRAPDRGRRPRGPAVPRAARRPRSSSAGSAPARRCPTSARRRSRSPPSSPPATPSASASSPTSRP